LDLRVEEVFLNLDQAVPCGLILSELTTNAFKHAFPDGKKGTVTIELHVDPDHNTVILRVADDGVGIPAGLDIFNNKSLGLQLVNNLVEQVDGELEIENFEGTAFRVSLKY
jgi:two-component sensor histidine kinase